MDTAWGWPEFTLRQLDRAELAEKQQVGAVFLFQEKKDLK